MHPFYRAKLITDRAFAARAPQNVFHREHEPFPGEPETELDCHLLFRRTFSLPDGAHRYTLYISADDYYKLYVNGTFVTQGPAPGYPQHYYYNTVDLTPRLHPGKNVIAVHTYYQGLCNRVWVSGDHRQGLICALYDRDTPVLCSDSAFLVRRHSGYTQTGRYGYDTQFAESYDARVPEHGFFAPDFDDSDWEHALPAVDDHTYFPQPTAQLTLYPLDPVICERHGDRLFLDFGQEIVGYPRLCAQGNAGDTVMLYAGEELCADGSVRWQMRCGCNYRECFTLSGGRDVLPIYDYKAFRYMEIEAPSHVRLTDVGATVRHYPFTCIRHFSLPAGLPPTCDAEALERIFTLCVNTIRYGVQETFMDCPSREKGQYFGDGVYTALSHMLLTGDTAMTGKMIENAFSSAFIHPCLMAGGPQAFAQEIAEYPLMTLVLIPLRYTFDRDRNALAAGFRAACRLIDAYARTYGRADGLIAVHDKWNVVDWPPEARDGYDCPLPDTGTPVAHNVINGYWLCALSAVNRAARLLGVSEPYDYRAAADAYMRTFYRPASGLFADTADSAHTAIGSNAFALLLDLPLPDGNGAILELIRQKRLNASNLFISPLILFGLFRAGQTDLLYDLLCDRNYWLRMLAEGATTTFEAFGKDRKWNTSLCHTMFALPVAFLCGWSPDDYLGACPASES